MNAVRRWKTERKIRQRQKIIRHWRDGAELIGCQAFLPGRLRKWNLVCSCPTCRAFKHQNGEKLRAKIPKLEEEEKMGGLYELHDALGYHQKELAENLIKSGTDVNRPGEWKNTPLHLASIWGDEEIIKLLIEKGAKVNVNNRFLETPLHLAVKNERQEAVKKLVENGADLFSLDYYSKMPLNLSQNNKTIYDYLLEEMIKKENEEKTS